VAIIGAGRLGTALGRALSGAGYPVKMVVAKSGANARKAARSIQGNPLAVASAQLSTLSTNQFQLLSQCNLILIATPDDLIEAVAAQVSSLFTTRSGERDAPGRRKNRCVALHTSGALSSEVLKPLGSLGFATGSLHPLVSVSNPASGAKLFRDAY